MTLPTPPGAHNRRAFTVFEMALAVILLMVAMTVSVQLLGWVAAERRAAERRHVAVRAVANLMELLTARPWDKLSAEALKAETLSVTDRDALPDADLAVVIDHQGAGDGAKRVAVRLRWRNRAGEWDAPVRLTTWVYPPKGGAR